MKNECFYLTEAFNNWKNVHMNMCFSYNIFKSHETHHVERKVPKYEHKIRERRVKTLTKNWRDHSGQAHENTSLSCVHKHSLSSDWEKWLCPSKYFDFVSVCLSTLISSIFKPNKIRNKWIVKRSLGKLKTHSEFPVLYTIITLRSFTVLYEGNSSQQLTWNSGQAGIG